MSNYRCSKCGLLKEAEYFYKNYAKKNGLESNCKECVLERKAKKYKMKVEIKKRKKINPSKVIDIGAFRLREEFIKRDEDEEQNVLREIFKTVHSINTLKVSGF